MIMEVRLKDIQKYMEKNSRAAQLKLRMPIYSFSNELLYDTDSVLGESGVEELLEKGFERVDVVASESHLETFNKEAPDRYRMPTDFLTLEELDNRIKQIEYVNRHSNKARRVIACKDIISNSGKLIFYYGETISFLKWTKVKFYLKGKRTFPIRLNEYKILVYGHFNLSTEGGSSAGVASKFVANTRLLYNLFSMDSYIKSDENLKHFNVETDLVLVDHPQNIFHMYRADETIRLVVIEDNENLNYRSELIKIRHFDPYTRFMIFSGMDDSEKVGFYQNMGARYKKDNWL